MPAIVDAYFRALPRSYLYFGFTTVVDLNVVDRARVEAVRRADVGPLVLDCGNGLAVANGYPMVFAPAPKPLTPAGSVFRSASLLGRSVRGTPPSEWS
jgi:hypothetical protein